MKKVVLLILPLFLVMPLLGQQTLGLFQNDSTAFDGYTLFSPVSYNKTYLIDNCGEVVHEWTSNFFPGMDVELQENGDLLRACRWNGSFNGGGVGGRVELYNWEGELLWGFIYANEMVHQHHDIELLPNGNVLLLAWEDKTDAQAIQAGRNPATIGSNGVWPEHIVEIEPFGINQGNIVWEWYIWDHLVQDFDPTKDNYGVVADHPELIDANFGVGNGSADWLHCNSIDYVESLDVIILNSRDFEEFWVIDHSTTTQEAAGHSGGNFGKGGDILYRWGNPMAYDRGTIDDKKLFKQHFPHWMEDGPYEGMIMLYNNGNNRPEGNYSTVDILQPELDADGNFVLEEGEPFGPENLSWSYGDNFDEFFFSSNMSGAIDLPNGNVLICVGAPGRFIEVNPAGELVWDYENPVNSSGPNLQGNEISGNGVFRVYRYPADFPAFSGKDLTPMGPLELEPLPSDCVLYPESTMVAVTNPERIQDIFVVGNPVAEELILQNNSQRNLLIEISDLAGRVIFSETSRDQLLSFTLWNIPAGLYLLHARDLESNEIFVQKIIKE